MLACRRFTCSFAAIVEIERERFMSGRSRSSLPFLDFGTRTLANRVIPIMARILQRSFGFSSSFIAQARAGEEGVFTIRFYLDVSCEARCPQRLKQIRKLVLRQHCGRNQGHERK